VAPVRCAPLLLLLWAAAGAGAAGGAVGGVGNPGELYFGSGPWRIKVPLSPFLCERRRRGGDVAVGVVPGDGLRWVLISLLSVMLLVSSTGSSCSFKASPARLAFSGRLDRFVVSSFSAKGRMIWASPGDVPSELPFMVAPVLGSWGTRSEEGGENGEVSSFSARMLLMRHRGRRCAREGVPWRWLMQRHQELELLGGKTMSSKLGGTGGRRCPSRKETQEVLVVIFSFFRVSFVTWGYTVLNF